MPNTEAKVVARPDRAIAVNHVVVPAHGATDVDFTKPQFDRAHELGAVETDKGDTDRKIEKSAVAERHVKSPIAGFDATKLREANVLAHRKESEKIFASTRKSIGRQG
jgi:hypothetical protein